MRLDAARRATGRDRCRMTTSSGECTPNVCSLAVVTEPLVPELCDLVRDQSVDESA